jgi:hypothetical protein
VDLEPTVVGMYINISISAFSTYSINKNWSYSSI